MQKDQPDYLGKYWAGSAGLPACLRAETINSIVVTEHVDACAPGTNGAAGLVTYNPCVHDREFSITVTLFYELTGKALVLANCFK